VELGREEQVLREGRMRFGAEDEESDVVILGGSLSFRWVPNEVCTKTEAGSSEWGREEAHQPTNLSSRLLHSDFSSSIFMAFITTTSDRRLSCKYKLSSLSSIERL